jgi:hypothetical protein
LARTFVLCVKYVRSGNFARGNQALDGQNRTTARFARAPAAMQNICRFGATPRFAKIPQARNRRNAVDLALRLDVLAVCAVFAFVTAILLGAF